MKRTLKYIENIGILAICFALIIQLSAKTEERLHVTVSILPQKYFVERIGGEHVAVSVMVSTGADLHTYEPKPQQLIHLSMSEIYFTIGVAFEKSWIDRFRSVNPEMRIVHTDRGIEKTPMISYHDSDNKNPRHDALDPHIWLSPPLVMIQARTILSALLRADPTHADDYFQNYRALIAEIVDLDIELRRLFSGQRGSNNKFMVFHPSWGYFARAYGLEQVPIEIEGKEPKPADVKRIIDFAREHRIGIIFVQPQFSARSTLAIANAVNAQVVFADPLAENWAVNLKKTAYKVKSALH
ncbi:metal ABC transporter solute-binding protein, Zn/Mn family [Candidatus Latescibacterota bacterium]